MALLCKPRRQAWLNGDIDVVVRLSASADPCREARVIDGPVASFFNLGRTRSGEIKTLRICLSWNRPRLKSL